MLEGFSSILEKSWRISTPFFHVPPSPTAPQTKGVLPVKGARPPSRVPTPPGRGARPPPIAAVSGSDPPVEGRGRRSSRVPTPRSRGAAAARRRSPPFKGRRRSRPPPLAESAENGANSEAFPGASKNRAPMSLGSHIPWGTKNLHFSKNFSYSLSSAVANRCFPK